MNTYTYFGAGEYNCDAYGQNAYGECSVDGANSGGSLSPTGDMILLPIALAAAILIASGIYLVKQLRRNKSLRAKSKTQQ